jgi:hypothetical protein
MLAECCEAAAGVVVCAVFFPIISVVHLFVDAKQPYIDISEFDRMNI